MLGFLNIYKEGGITSHDAINALRKILKIKQIGHGGTLDPMAEGVLFVAVGKACRLLNYVRDDKVYRARIRLGQSTDTDDIEGTTTSVSENLGHIDRTLLEAELSRFLGKQLQIPPVYSAIKRGGKKMCDMARRGEAPEDLPGRPVEIFAIDFIEYDSPELTIRVACSKGTYIRSIARDLGQALGTGGCLSGLIRERSGPLSIENALRPAAMIKDDIETNLIPPWTALELERYALSPEEARRLAHGQTLKLEIENDRNQESPGSETGGEERKRMIACSGEKPVALVNSLAGGILKPEVVLTGADEI